MNISVILHAYYLDDTRVIRHCEWLSKNGKTVTVFCLNKGGESKEDVVNGVVIKRAPVSRSKSKTKLSYLVEYFLFFFFSFYQSTKALIVDKPDLYIINNMPNALVFTALIPRVFGVPVLLDVHDLMPELCEIVFSGKESFLKKVLLLEERLSFNFATHLMTVSKPVVRLLSTRCKKKFHITHNSPSNFSENNNELEGAPKIVFHGNIHERYGIQRILEPLNNLAANGCSFVFHIHGKGPYVNELNHLIKDHNYIKFHGEFVPHEVPNILQGAALGVIMNYPNRSNDFALPVKMLEYIANNVAVICPKLPVIQEYFTEDSVFYFNDNSDLQSVIELALSNEQLRRDKAKVAFQKYTEIAWENEKHDYLTFIEACNEN